MLKGHVFSKQLFGHPIFALFINTFLNGQNGVSNNYGEGMKMTTSGRTVTVYNGAVCIQGRFLEEDTHTEIAVGTDDAYCKLVIEIDLDKQNTEDSFVQATYKIVKSASGYPNLTQQNIVKNNAGIYQYELARFKTNVNGITEFQDMRMFLNFDSIYDAIQAEYRAILLQLQQELANVADGSDYLLKSTGGTVAGKIIASGGIEGNLDGNSTTASKFATEKNIELRGAVSGNANFDGSTNVIINTTQANIAVLTGNITISNGEGTTNVAYPARL